MAAVETVTNEAVNKSEAVQAFIMHHVANSDEWQLPFVHIPLPHILSLHGLMLVLCGVFLILLFGVLYRKKDPVPHGLTNLLEVLVLFVRNNISIACLGEEDGRRMAPLFCTFFFFVLCLNLMGLIPIFSTATSNINVTGAMALVTLGFMVFGSIYKLGFPGFVRCFVPHGVPWPVLIILVPIEFASMFIKAFALMIRLFANMLAGHIVILSLLGLVVTFGLFALPAMALTIGIFLLEIFVCLLQAYIFTFLSAMFMGQLYHPQH